VKKIILFLLLIKIAPANAVASQVNLEKMIRPWGKETVENTKSYFAGYRHILLFRVDKDYWESKNRPEHSAHHYVGTVIKVYKGEWKPKRLAVVTFTDGPVSHPKPMAGRRQFVFSNQEPTGSEIALDTGEMLPFDKALEPALLYFGK
jgi:hypothetical protein